MLRALLHAAFAGASASASKPPEPPADAIALLQFLELFARHAAVDVPGLDLYLSAAGLMN